MKCQIVAFFAAVACLSIGANAQCTLVAGDVATLNFALTLEHLEATFYSALNDSVTYPQLSQANFTAAGYPASVFPYLQMIYSHEATHVAALTATLTNAGCSAVPACAYNFSQAYASIPNFLATAYALESTGVSAYDGQINTIFDGTLRQVAATIATVEGRHTAYLGTVMNQSTPSTPFPNITDIPLGYQQVYAIAGAFLVNASSCSLPTNISVVQANYSGVYNYGFQTPSSTGACGIFSGDQTTLNYALALEHLEANYYATGIANTTLTSQMNATELAYIQIIAGHEAAHVTFLTSVFSGYGCASNAAPACTYNFGTAYNNVSSFIATALALESTGVTAYDGALFTLRDASFRQAAATIATVEGRHASVLALLNSSNPFPAAFDTAANSSSVLAIAGQFISSCPSGYTPSGPAFVAVSLNASAYAIGGAGVSQTTASPTTVSQTTVSQTTVFSNVTTGVHTTGVQATTANAAAATTKVAITGATTSTTSSAVAATTSGAAQLVGSAVLVALSVFAAVL